MSSVDKAQNNISFTCRYYYLKNLILMLYQIIQKMILARMPRKERKER